MKKNDNNDYRIGFISLGCAKNQVDSEIMLAKLKNEGFKIVSDIERADIVIINTCGFIEDARQESINTIIETGQLKERGLLQYLVCTGCLAQRYGQELLDELPELDGLIGISSFPEIDKYLHRIINGERLVAVSPPPQIFIEKGPRVLTTPAGFAYLKITEGCNNRCSYCAIPSIRGKLRSRPAGELVNEARELAGKGSKELVLIGQDTAVYGQDLHDELGLSKLLQQLVKVDGLQWIRLLYMHPAHIDQNIIAAIAAEDKVIPYLDIPVQHASDNMLKAMNRKHSSADLRRLIPHLRKEIAGLVLRTTVMLGFPGESEDDFKQLYDFIGETEFDWLGAFAFTPEEDTPAFSMPNQIPDEIKQQRLSSIMKLQKNISRKKNKKRLQQNYEILISSQASQNLYLGRGYFQAPAVDGITMVKSEQKLPKGEFVKVELKAIRNYDMIGEIVDESSE
ncbi:MAG TPA: 30S ribosomal protein S12 methylthiotransferase RimO [Syntrophomonas sp.]|nr:30S ribosomal protein S12 methylthiotransferase RimO [Syntrophomonas sp.]